MNRFVTLKPAWACAFLLLVTFAGVGADGRPEYFVGANGRDDASGESEDQALRSITEGLRRARMPGGAILRILPGVYGKETESFPLEPPPYTTITAQDQAHPPRIIAGTRLLPVFWVHDIQWEPAPEQDGEPPWPEPDENAPVLSHLIIQDGGRCWGGTGGGILVEGATLLVTDCEVVENHSGRGSGVTVVDGSKVVFRRCKINRNYGCGGTVDQGTGVHLSSGSIGAFEDCEILGNDGQLGTAGVHTLFNVQLFMRDCRILDNYGNPLAAERTRVTLERCVISGHPLDGDNAEAPISIYEGHLVLRDCLVYGNRGGRSSLVLSESSGLISGSTIAYNSGGSYGAGGRAMLADSDPFDPSKTVLITNSIFWGNESYDLETEPASPRPPGILLRRGEIRYSIVQDSIGPLIYDYWYIDEARRNGLIDADPLFADPRSGDFRLLPGSPAIDAGDPAWPPDADGSRRDLGASFPGLPPHYIFIRGDPNGDGRVDISDVILILFGLFVSRDYLTCPDAADANDDGVLDVTDPVLILGFLFRSEVTGLRPPFPRYGLDWTELDMPEDDLPPCRW